MKHIFFLSLISLFAIKIIAQNSLDSLKLFGPIGHTSMITSVQVRNNILYTGSHDKTVKLWDLRSKKELLTYTPSSDIVFAIDVTQDGELVVSTHQKNYLVVHNVRNRTLNNTILLDSDEMCEKAYFVGHDSLIAALIYESNFNKSSISIFNLKSLKRVKQTDVPIFSEKLLTSEDRRNWFYLINDETVAWSRTENGDLKSDVVKFDFNITNYAFDNLQNELIVYGEKQISVYNLEKKEKRIVHNNVKEVGLTKLDMVIPSINDDFLLVENNNLYLLEAKTDTLLDLGFLGSNEVRFVQNVWDSSIIIAGDVFIRYKCKNRRSEKFSLFNRNNAKTIFDFSDRYLAIINELGVQLYARDNLRRHSARILSRGKQKYKYQTSSNGEYIGIMNSIEELEVFRLSDLSSYTQLLIGEAIVDYRISNEGSLYVLNEKGKIDIYNVINHALNRISLDLDFEIQTFTLYDELNEIWFITKELKLVKCELDNLKIRKIISLSDQIDKTTIISNDLNSYIDIKSDNYSYCEMSFGRLIKNTRENKVPCSTGVTEGQFKYGLSEDGNFVCYIGEDNENLIVVDVEKAQTIQSIDISMLDEISDVSISASMNMLCFSTLDDSVYCYDLISDDLEAKIIKNFKEVNDIKIDDVNEFVLIASSDGKFSINQAHNLKQIYSMFSANNGYIVKLPNSPHYMCSKDASKMLHYVTPSLKVIGFEQLDLVYNRPDIVLDSIGKYFYSSDDKMIANYHEYWVKRMDRLGLDKEKIGNGEIAVPKAMIVNAEEIEYENINGQAIIHYKVNDPDFKLRSYNIVVNEVPVHGSAGNSLVEFNTNDWEGVDTITLSKGENKVQLSVMNELGLENFKYPTYVNYTPQKDIPVKTHYIGIGVNEFKDDSYNLNFCVKDVKDLSDVFAGITTSSKVFTNEEVIKENILKLKQYLMDSTTVNDRVVISCSSHGLLDDSLNFYLATYDVDFRNPRARGLKYEELEGLLDGIPARKKLLLLDACNSGENDKTDVLNKRMEQLKTSMDSSQLVVVRGAIVKREKANISNFIKMNELFVNVRNNTGSVIISAAGGQESALEAITVDGKLIENGAFTYCVLEFFKEHQNKQDDLTINNLKKYVEWRVEQITNGKQKPTSRQETMEVDWNLDGVKNTKIKD